MLSVRSSSVGFWPDEQRMMSYLRLANILCSLNTSDTSQPPLKWTRDIFEAMDDSRSTLLVALGMWASFITISLTMVVYRLRYTFYAFWLAFQWVELYLHKRSSFLSWDTRWCTSTSMKPASNKYNEAGVQQQVPSWCPRTSIEAGVQQQVPKRVSNNKYRSWCPTTSTEAGVQQQVPKPVSNNKYRSGCPTTSTEAGV